MELCGCEEATAQFKEKKTNDDNRIRICKKKIPKHPKSFEIISGGMVLVVVKSQNVILAVVNYKKFTFFDGIHHR